jgi:predicted nucleotidyltransferase
MISSPDPEFLREISRSTNERNRVEHEAARQAQAERLAAARAEAERLAREFRVADQEIDRIVLFGSVATGEVGSREFDIDLAVRSARYLRLVAIGLDSDFRVDVVDLDGAREPIRRAIERDGKVLYAKDQGAL